MTHPPAHLFMYVQLTTEPVTSYAVTIAGQ